LFLISEEKKMKKITLIVFMVFVAFLFVTSCKNSGAKKGEESAVMNELEGAPAWLLGNEDSSERICGVGSSAEEKDKSRAKTTAMANAKTEIAKTLQIQIKSMLKDYQATTADSKAFGPANSDEQYIEDISKQITDTVLASSELKKTWTSSSGTIYVLVCLDLQKFKDALNNMSQLNEQIRAAVVERANMAFN
jgi:hypothetical protein